MSWSSAAIIPPDGEYPHLHLLVRRFHLILASQSPRRRHLLSQLGIEFEVLPAHVNEQFEPKELPADVATRLAVDKSLTVSRVYPEQLVIGCDTVVSLKNTIMDKPRDAEDACRILAQLSGNSHEVITAIACAQGGRVIAVGSESTLVRFRVVTDEQIGEYVKTGEPLDKAGAYGIQGMGGFLVDSIEGRLDTVVGLPRTLLNHLAEEILGQNS